MKNRIYLQTKAGQPRRECQCSVANENRIYVQAKAGQPWRECQCSVTNEKIEFTYNLRQDNHGEIVSVQWLMKNQIYVPSKAGKPCRECQYTIDCDQFYRHAHLS